MTSPDVTVPLGPLAFVLHLLTGAKLKVTAMDLCGLRVLTSQICGCANYFGGLQQTGGERRGRGEGRVVSYVRRREGMGKRWESRGRRGVVMAFSNSIIGKRGISMLGK